MNEFEGKTDDELETLREAGAENSHIPSSMFNRVTRELERRHRKKIEESLGKPLQTIGILNQGKNNKFFGNTFTGFDIGIKDQGESTEASGNKFQSTKNFKPVPDWNWFNFWTTLIIIVIAFLSIPFLQPLIVSYINLPNEDNTTTQLPVTSTSTISLSEILSKAIAFGTVVEKQDFLKKYVGSNVSAEGIVEEVSRSGDGFLVDISIDRQTITCPQDQSDDNEKIIPLLKGKYVQFTGTFPFTQIYGHGLGIDNCVLKRLR